MPPLTSLALRYVLWFVGLSILYALLVSFAGLPTSLATGVILASAPAADVGLQATRRATRVLATADWVKIWALCMGIYVLLSVAGPLVLAATVTGLEGGYRGVGHRAADGDAGRGHGRDDDDLPVDRASGRRGPHSGLRAGRFGGSAPAPAALPRRIFGKMKGIRARGRPVRDAFSRR
jgi:hypothetical protein